MKTIIQTGQRVSVMSRYVHPCISIRKNCLKVLGLKLKSGFGVCLTHIVQHFVPLQLSVPDLVLQHHQLLFVLLFESVEPSLAVLQLVDQLLLDGDLTGDVGQVGLDVFCTSTHRAHSSSEAIRAVRIYSVTSHFTFLIQLL